MRRAARAALSSPESMSQQLQAQANAVLYRALEQPPASRHTFIDQACAGCHELVDLVHAMLSHIDQLDAFLDEPLTASAAAEETADGLPAAGDQIGRWQVMRVLERTPLGHALLVENLEDQPRRSALMTIVDAAALSLEQLALFHRQRELLGSLAHPGIARLLDSGALADGEPYIVMELGEGLPIDVFCRDTGATREGRITLLVQACLSLHYAHQHLLLHRQLTPACLRVAPTGVVKIVEFDIAGLADSAARSTLDDIAALGAVLRTLLQDAGGRLERGLQTIIERACGADPLQAYGSSDQLARALQDYLDQAAAPVPADTPVTTTTPRRHPLARAIGAAVLVAAGAGATLAWQSIQSPVARQQPAAVAQAEPQAQPQVAAPADATIPASTATQAAATAQAEGKRLIEEGDSAAGLAQLRAAVAAREELAKQLKGDAGKEARLDAAAARVALAMGLAATEAYAAADAEFKRAREAYAALPSPATRAAIARLDLARADAQYLRKHWRTAGQTVRALRAALPPDADSVLQARAALLEALIQPGGTALQAYAAAQKALPVLLFDLEADPANLPKLRESALAWRRVGEIAARAGQTKAACDYYRLAEGRYAELESGNRLNQLDRKARRQLDELRAGCA